MARYRRNFIPGGTYFFTVTLADRRSTMLVNHIGDLRSAFRAARGARRATIFDRCHCDSPGSSARHSHLADRRRRFSEPLATNQGAFQQRADRGIDLKRRPNGDLALWQRRFWEHTVRDDRDFARHVDYVHFNPVKHGLVSRVRGWPYSSFHRYVREGLLPDDWADDGSEDDTEFGEPTG